MSISLEQKLALERCQLYLSQLHAITHFMAEDEEEARAHKLTHIHSLIRQTVNDIKLVEELAT